METTDPVALIERLDPDAIAARLEALGREERALRVLLRSARARQRRDRQRRPDAGTPESGVTDAR